MLPSKLKNHQKIMRLNDKGTKRIALAISLFLHLILLSCSIPSKEIIVVKEDKMLEVPIQMVMVKPEIPKVEKKSVTPYKKKKTVTKGPAITKSKKEEKPKHLPGDRSNPVVKKTYSIVFPKEALNIDLAGKVSVLFHINEKGRPYKYRLVKSSGHEILDKAFIRTVMNFYTFNPKRLYGKNEKGRIKLTHEF